MAIDKRESTTAISRDSSVRERVGSALALPTDTSRSEATRLGAQFAGMQAPGSTEALSARGILNAGLYPGKKAVQTGVVLSEMWQGAKAGARVATSTLFDGRTTLGGAIDVIGNDIKGGIGSFLLAPLRPILAAVVIPVGIAGGAAVGFLNGLRKYPWRG